MDLFTVIRLFVTNHRHERPLICANECRKHYLLFVAKWNCHIRILFVISFFVCVCSCSAIHFPMRLALISHKNMLTHAVNKFSHRLICGLSRTNSGTHSITSTWANLLCPLLLYLNGNQNQWMEAQSSNGSGKQFIVWPQSAHWYQSINSEIDIFKTKTMPFICLKCWKIIEKKNCEHLFYTQRTFTFGHFSNRCPK